MRAQLLVRPGFNDHEAIADFLAPAPGLQSGPPVFQRLVVEAQTAIRRPRFAQVASQAGMPLLIDPMTPIGQGPVRERDAWLELPYSGSAGVLGTTTLGGDEQRKLVEEVVAFELAHGATAIIPPYYYSVSPSDSLFERNLLLIEDTQRLLDRYGIDLPLVPIFCGRLQTFAADGAWDEGFGKFVSLVSTTNTDFVGLCLSPIGNGKERVGKLLPLFTVAQKLGEALPVVGWRQGIYGPALVAAGALGYETGIATGEQCDIPGSVARRRRERKKNSGGGGPGTYVEAFGRSLTQPVTEVLMADEQLKAQLMCVEPSCCPDGVKSTASDKRGHALRSRARQLREYERQPHRTWRLYQVERSAYNAVTLAQQATRVLQEAGLKTRVHDKGMAALGEVARVLREQADGQQVA